MSIFRAHVVKTDAFNKLKGGINVRFDHTFVSTEAGASWGCNGRDLKQAKNAEIIATSKTQSPARSEWIRLIGDNNAQVEYTVDGICHQIANRKSRRTSEIRLLFRFESLARSYGSMLPLVLD